MLLSVPMKGQPRKRAFALAYTLIVAAVIFLFAGALFMRATETIRYSGIDVNSVHATALADTGAQLAYALLRDHDPQYFKTQNPLRSIDLGPDFAPSVIGGTFEVTVDDADYTATGLYPDNGTFYTLVSTGRVGNHSARSEMTLKMTNPLLNYLFLSPRNLWIGAGTTVVGPIVVNADPVSGEPGNLTLSHASEYYNGISHAYQMDQGDLKLDIQARASGDIQIANGCDHGNTAPPLLLNGRYPPQSLQNQDFNILCTWGSWAASVIFTDECALEAHAKFTTKIPTMKKLLEKFRTGAGPAPLDITSAGPEGVLVEFTNGQVFVSQAARRQIGRVYDKALALDEGSYPMSTDYYEPYFGITPAQAQAKLDAEVAWDDPGLPDDNYPADIGPGTGDYCDVYRTERAAPLASYTLSATNWTTIYLTTSRTDFLSVDGKPMGPPVFVRGIVKGKVMVVYDVTDDTLDPNEDRLHMMILGEHEMPADSPANKLPTGGAPGVVGGVLYADRNIKTDPDQVVFSSDRCVLLCRGTLTGAGDPGVHRGHMHDMAGNPVNYRQQIWDLDAQYSNYYTGTPGDWDFRCSPNWIGYWGDGPHCNFYGIAVASHAGGERWRIRSDGQFVDARNYDYPGGIAKWGDMGVASPPAGEATTDVAIFPFAMRRARCAPGYSGDVRGSFHSLVTAYKLSGDAHYDYSWQALKEAEIRTEMFLPIQPVIASFQRL